MSFAAYLTRSPIPFDAALGADCAEQYADQPPEIKELITGVAGCSPYLMSALNREHAWLEDALAREPDEAFAILLENVRRLDAADIRTGLRQAKRRAALYIALADLGGVWALHQVTRALTDFADLAVERAMRSTIADEVRRGKLNAADETASMVAIAMGKMGAYELNYSSDIDLIILFDSDRYGDEIHDARSALVRATRRMTSVLSEITGDGYVFRTDLRLRPDAAVTPVCLSMDAAEGYYESVGRTWERAAYIKARAAAGDIEAGEGFLKRLLPFVWRKHLDFAAIQDAHDMRLRIRAHKGTGGALKFEGHNLKLGAGGIREIEFFTQTRQIISGGRDQRLRVRGTEEGLSVLADAGWIEGEVAQTLSQAYRAHREVEHRLQMIADAQTHDLPPDEPGFARLAAFMGRDETSLRAELQDRLTEVHELTEGFFAPTTTPAEAANVPDEMQAVVDGWHSYPALRSARAGEIFARLKPEVVDRLQKASRPKEAVEQFDHFLAGLPAGVQLFSLFEANPQLIDLIVDIAATAPALAQYLGRNAQVFDAVIGGSFFDEWPGCDALRSALTARLHVAGDYEDQLDAARRWHKEWHFRIGVHLLRGLINAEEAGQHYADLAGAVLGAVWPTVVAEFSSKHGSPPGRGAAVVGMGSLGAEQLSAMSDLDLIVIYDAGGVEASDGRRPLPSRVYFARLTQALVTAVSAQTAEGALYEVDMRLRPSGRQGPVAKALDSFRTYQETEAWTWEHLALTRARVVAGDVALAADVEELRQSLLSAPRDRVKTIQDVAEMRGRLADAKPGEGIWDAKLGAGHLQDIDLLGQCAALLAGAPDRRTPDQLAAGVGVDLLDQGEVNALVDAYTQFWRSQAASRLLTGRTLEFETLGAGGRAFLMRQLGTEDIAATQELLDHASKTADQIISEALERIQ